MADAEQQNASSESFGDELEDHRFLRTLLDDDGDGVRGPGDDCALVGAPRASAGLYATSDSLVEGRHYDPSAARVEEIARKLVERNFSDLAAMGAWPTCVLVNFVFGRGWDRERRRLLYRSVDRHVRARGARWIGGDIASTDGKSVFCLVAMGEPAVRDDGSIARVVTRSGLLPGDALCVSGPLGGSLVRGRHLSFDARLDFAKHLVTDYEAHAMIDISDSLLLDLQRLLDASSAHRVEAILWQEAVPIHSDAKLHAASSEAAFEAALCDGEDYELLFGLAEDAVPQLLADPELRGVAQIGVVIAAEDASARIRVRGADGGLSVRDARGYVHRYDEGEESNRA